jgi:hypothetical protein
VQRIREAWERALVTTSSGLFPDDEKPVVPDRAPEDTDAAWGDRDEGDSNDDRLERERPPHWE